MKRFILAILIIAIASIPSQAKYSGGSGEPNNPYQIADANDLMTLANDANDYNKCFIMTADIDLDPCLPGNQVFTKAVIAPDNSTESPFQGIEFTGNFNGAGHKILNLTINTYGQENGFLGLFGYISGGNISGLGIENVNISPGDYSWPVGSLAGYSEDSVTNCFSSGNINGTDYISYVGGLIGINAGSIAHCHSTVNITSGSILGGLVGENDNIIIDSFSQGTITGSDTSWSLGGLVGSNGYYDGCGKTYIGTIINCFSISDVNGKNNAVNVGGLVGTNDHYSTIQHSYSTGNVKGGGALGGLVGDNSGNINVCFSTSAIIGEAEFAPDIGGIAGSNSNGVILNSYSQGNVTGKTNIGGAVGLNYYGDINQCYSTGLVNGQTSYGGFVGGNDYGTIYNCYFLNIAGPNNGFGTPLTDTQMKQQASFIGWDFVWETANGSNDIWAICEGVTYPKLAWQFIPGDFDNGKDVNFSDFAMLGSKWIQADSSFYCGGIDLTGDGLVDLDDLLILCDNWLILTPPVPAQAANPVPNNDSIDINVMSDLSWTAGYKAVFHDVYFGTNNPPPFRKNQIETVFDPGVLDTNTIYYWHIDEQNISGKTTGVLWNFKTVVQLPGQASNPYPADGANNVNVSLYSYIYWYLGELATSYDVYFGTTNPPSFKVNQTDNLYGTGMLDPNTTYYWRIDAKNASGTTTGTVWSFRTSPTPVSIAAGGGAAGITSITPSLPSGIRTNDILLLFVETPNRAVTITDANGGTWNEVANSPQGTGTAGAAAAVRLTAFWSRYNGTQGAPTAAAASSDQIIGRIIAFRNVTSDGNPWNVTSGNVVSTASRTFSITGATTTVPNTLVVAVIANTTDRTVSQVYPWANSNLTNITILIDDNTDIGGGGGFGVATGIKTTAGNYGVTTGNLLDSSTQAMMTIALKP